MITLLKKMFVDNVSFDLYHEGMYAHEYRDTLTREKIASEYKQRYMPDPTPFSHPERYDPLNPPKGWAYDPFYECWIHIE